MTWTLPDAEWTPAVSPNLVDWTQIDAMPTAIGGTRGVLLQDADVPAGTQGYFRMESGN